MEMEGDKKDQNFGVMDIVPLSDFPDMRQSCVIHSNSGSVMTVPRENRLLRLYVQLGRNDQSNTSQIEAEHLTPEVILTYAKPILTPYNLDFHVCDWYSMYTVGQRLAPSFDYKQRIFLAGDAVHTHSPTLGQGMNVSMQDAYNLGWKICSVLGGESPPEILSTYTHERRLVAEELIQLDKEMMEFYCNGPSKHSREYQLFRAQFSEFLSGVSVTYKDTILVTDSVDGRNPPNNKKFAPQELRRNQNLAKYIIPGRRIPTHKVVCHAEAAVIQLLDVLPSNGKWRILVFGGNILSKAQSTKIEELGSFLHSLCLCYSPGQIPESTIEVILLHAAPREEIDILELHDVYHPGDEKLGWDYWKVLSDDASTFEDCGSAYEKFGVDKEQGCVVILRPDQHVSYIGGIDDHGAIERFFGRVLIPRRQV